MYKEEGRSTFSPFNILVASSIQLDHLANYMGITVMGNILPLLPCLQRQDESTFLGIAISQPKKGKWLCFFCFFFFQHSLKIVLLPSYAMYVIFWDKCVYLISYYAYHNN